MDIDICFLTFNRNQEFKRTLDTFSRIDLFNNKIVFSQNGKLQQQLNKYNLIDVSCGKHIPMGDAVNTLIDNVKSNYFIFCEDDFSVTHGAKKDDIRITLEECKTFLDEGAMCVKLRNPLKPGNPVFSRHIKGREQEGNNMNFLLESVYWDTKVNEKFSEVKRHGNVFYSSSKYSNYTNNPCIYNTERFRSLLYDKFKGLSMRKQGFGGLDIEVILHNYWRDIDFTIGHHLNGFLTHEQVRQ